MEEVRERIRLVYVKPSLPGVKAAGGSSQSMDGENRAPIAEATKVCEGGTRKTTEDGGSEGED